MFNIIAEKKCIERFKPAFKMNPHSDYGNGQIVLNDWSAARVYVCEGEV